MTDYPISSLPALPTLHAWSLEAPGVSLTNTGVAINSAASGGWLGTNRATLFPFQVFEITTFQNAFIWNGATVSGNFEIAVYDRTYTKLATTGAVAQAGINTIQMAALTVTLPPGAYYLALAFDNTTATVFRVTTSVPNMGADGIVNGTSMYPLPAGPLTVNYLTFSSIYIYGLTQRGFM